MFLCFAGAEQRSRLSHYAAVRANLFRRHVDVEEATFLRAVGDVAGKGVLDLACGTGHYARLLKARGAENVHGVDNSEELLKEARRHESADGVTYYRHDLIEGPPPKPLFQPDVVIASWLLPYASNFNELLEFCEAAAVNLESGGRFVGITTLFTDFIAGRVCTTGGGKIETDPLTRSLHWESHPHDGMEATVSIFTEDRKTRATFPNHLWSKRSVERALEASGFEKISWVPLAADGAPDDTEESYEELVGVFTARLA